MTAFIGVAACEPNCDHEYGDSDFKPGLLILAVIVFFVVRFIFRLIIGFRPTSKNEQRIAENQRVRALKVQRREPGGNDE
jgi:hypothetical protein